MRIVMKIIEFFSSRVVALAIILAAILLAHEMIERQPKPSPKPFGVVGIGNAIYDVQCNTTTISPTAGTFTAVANGTGLSPGVYDLRFANKGAVDCFFSFDGTHPAGAIPASTSDTESIVNFTAPSNTIYLEAAPGGSAGSGVYVWGHRTQ
jgi:hypothetical protein